ncbi:energy-coupling factor transporter ATPase [Paenibacillus lentus]|uniref:Energy-coupling factor transporter ATP-binding protein EcfA2 n=1 Tax=Paenibacillus lentus TaxID=1338368 RepID=A0A3S8RQ35_9BACL|nr:energy-coupling factor transporter ATPase [Paenibacillus lentus]AZK44923.1 energy-coupling factor transporter ATPase [Paenibacillus lentus]
MAITFDEVSYAYDDRTLWRSGALEGVNLDIPPGTFTGIAGTTGSGKSTLLQHFNGILRPTEGRVRILDVVVNAREKAPKMSELRRRVGLVFQFPEQQLFEDTVEKDLCFGPLNFGMSLAEARERARWALDLLGLDESLLSRNPFHLSGGQMRKVAIASVLAMDPEVIALDEPTATLDPQSRAELAALLSKLHREQGKTVIVVTHRMEELLPYVDGWIIMKSGRTLFQGTTDALVRESAVLEQEGLALPECITLWNQLAAQYGMEGEKPCLTPDSLAERLEQAFLAAGRSKDREERLACGESL